MNLTVYKNFSKRKNSTKRPTGGSRLNVLMKQNCSIEAPIFLIDGIDLDVNYLYWNDAYYFVTDITLNKNDIYEISAEIDVLATFKDQIGASTQFIERAASDYDSMLKDPLLSGQQVINGMSGNATTISFMDPSPGTYIIQTFSLDGVKVYAYDDMEKIQGILNNNCYGISDGSIKSLMQTIGFNILDVSAYVSNPMWLPVDINSLIGTPNSPVSVGFWLLTTTTSLPEFAGKLLKQPFYIKTEGTINRPASVYGIDDFRSYDPEYSRYNMYLPGVGVVPVPSIYLASTLTYSLTLDIFTGNCTYLIYTKNEAGATSLIGRYSGQLGVVVPYSTTKTDYASIAQSILTPNLNMAGGSFAGAAASIAQGAANEAWNVIRATLEPSISINSAAGNMSELQLRSNIIMTCTNFGTKQFPTAEAGRPLCEHRQISTLSGFIKCGSPSLEIPGHSNEKDRVNAYMASGFYYE